MTMQDDETPAATTTKRAPWNKGKLVGAKPPLRPKHVWSIRTKLQIADRKRDLAMFNLAIDSKLRGCGRALGWAGGRTGVERVRCTPERIPMLGTCQYRPELRSGRTTRSSAGLS